VYDQVDCKGCAEVEVNTSPIIHCPAMIITASTQAATPTTQHITVCSPTPTPGAVLETEDLQARQLAIPLPKLLCGTTLFISAGLDWGPTSTTYLRSTSTTSRVSCGGCSLVLSTKIGGQGPVYKPTVTLTASLAISTVYQCT
jgi:hypothetical protein